MKKALQLAKLTILLLSVFTIGGCNTNEQNAKNAVSCMAENEFCNKVDQKNLEPSLRIKFNKFIDIRNARIKQAKAEYVANQLIKEKDLVISRRNEAEKTKKEQATFEAEGWWEQEKGIFVRWCSDTNPCPETDTYLDSSWRAMVWCKERACGDIYAKLNITNQDVVVGWTNDTAYGDIGQKVVLTFQSSTSGKGRIVEFKARG